MWVCVFLWEEVFFEVFFGRVLFWKCFLECFGEVFFWFVFFKCFGLLFGECFFWREVVVGGKLGGEGGVLFFWEGRGRFGFKGGEGLGGLGARAQEHFC